MKIVIDLDKKYYNDIKNSPTASNYSTLYALFGIRNGTLLSEELEKIRTEIIACTQQEEGEVPDCINYGIKLSTEIVEKHITELERR